MEMCKSKCEVGEFQSLKWPVLGMVWTSLWIYEEDGSEESEDNVLYPDCLEN